MWVYLTHSHWLNARYVPSSLSTFLAQTDLYNWHSLSVNSAPTWIKSSHPEDVGSTEQSWRHVKPQGTTDCIHKTPIFSISYCHNGGHKWLQTKHLYWSSFHWSHMLHYTIIFPLLPSQMILTYSINLCNTQVNAVMLQAIVTAL